MTLKIQNQHVFITGGSSGLGLAIAIECARRGAHVTVVARREAVLRDAVATIRQACQTKTQRINYVTADCSNADAIDKALDQAIKLADNLTPYMVVCNAGTALPKTFLDHEPRDFELLMQTNYLSATYTSHAALRRIVDAAASRGEVAQGKIVFVSSVAGLIGFTGYSAYSPTKAAIIALADCLRHELIGGGAAGVTVHTFLPGSIDTPGFTEEQKTKPELTRMVEKDDLVEPPNMCAAHLFRGLDAGHFQITTSFNGDLLRVGSKCHAPANNAFLDFFKYLIAWVGVIWWRVFELDLLAKKHPAIPKPTTIQPAVTDEDED